MIGGTAQVKDIREGVFYPTRFASPQGTLIPLTPQESLVVYRARRPGVGRPRALHHRSCCSSRWCTPDEPVGQGTCASSGPITRARPSTGARQGLPHPNMAKTSFTSVGNSADSREEPTRGHALRSSSREVSLASPYSTFSQMSTLALFSAVEVILFPSKTSDRVTERRLELDAPPVHRDGGAAGLT